jgi:hypothetical protein
MSSIPMRRRTDAPRISKTEWRGSGQRRRRNPGHQARARQRGFRSASHHVQLRRIAENVDTAMSPFTVADVCCAARPPETAMRPLALLSLLLVTGGAWAQDACTALARTPSAPVALPALAPELTAPAAQLGAPSGVLAQAFDEAQSVDAVLLRLRIDKCRAAAMSTTPGQFAPGMDPASYKPQTQFDNTPWRFDMNQNGKRMTADEFDAWMKARGVRVAKGATPVVPPPAPAPEVKDDK